MAAINMQISRRCCWGVELIWALFVPSAGPKKKKKRRSDAAKVVSRPVHLHYVRISVAAPLEAPFFFAHF